MPINKIETPEQFAELAAKKPVDALKVWLAGLAETNSEYKDTFEGVLEEDEFTDQHIADLEELMYYSRLVTDRGGESQLSVFGFNLELLDSEGGGEGEGEHVERVIGFKNCKTGELISCICYTGFYSSYEGTEWDYSSFEQVWPQEVVVTQYFTAQEMKKRAKSLT